MHNYLRDRRHGVEVLIFFQIRQLLCHHDYEGDLDDLRRLNTNAEETQPAVVAGVALRAEENERYEQRRAQAIEPGPVLGENIHVYDRHRNKKQDAEAESQRLDDDVLRGAVRI